jgi:hypothetical protein
MILSFERVLFLVVNAVSLGGCLRMSFFFKSSLFFKNNTRNIKQMASFFLKCIDLGKNDYSWTTS